MKLWLCCANCDDCEPFELHIAKTAEEAIRKMANELDDLGIWYASISADVVEVVEGYGIEVITN